MKTQDSGRLPHGLPRGTTDTRRPSRTPGPPFLVKESVEGAGARWAPQPRGPGQVRETAQEAPGAPPVALAGRAGGAERSAQGPGPRSSPASSLCRQRRARWGPGGPVGRGRKARGRTRGRRFPPSKVSRSCVHSALPVGVGAAPSWAGRPPARSGRKREDASRAVAAAGPREPKGAEKERPWVPRSGGAESGRGAARGRCRGRGGARAPAGQGWAARRLTRRGRGAWAAAPGEPAPLPCAPGPPATYPGSR